MKYKMIHVTMINGILYENHALSLLVDIVLFWTS